MPPLPSGEDVLVHIFRLFMLLLQSLIGAALHTAPPLRTGDAGRSCSSIRRIEILIIRRDAFNSLLP